MSFTSKRECNSSAFTLIELSIVLVIIGLIIGGILVGRDLISAAAIRSQISQIEKIQTGVNTFKLKYNAVPGDMSEAEATGFGFGARAASNMALNGNGNLYAARNANGYLEGSSCDGCTMSGGQAAGGETLMFWSDLTYANGMNINLIEGTFSAATATATAPTLSSTNLSQYFPAAKLGDGGYVIVASPSLSQASGCGPTNVGCMTYNNYLVVQKVTSTGSASVLSNTNIADYMSVNQAYAIDKKMDDGNPYMGSVIAASNYYGGFGLSIAGIIGSATAGSASTCADNGGAASTAHTYSLSQQNGNGRNCTLAFRLK